MAVKVSIVEYPFVGEIYRTFIDDSKPLEEQVEEKVVVLKTKCDIQEASSYNRGNFINATYNIYMPFDTNKTVNFKRGDLFEANAYGMVVNGEIIGIYPSQLGGISLFIKDIDV